MTRERRLELIESIQTKRQSKVIAYITSDRKNLVSQISGDAVSILHDHILAIDRADRAKLDLLIYSRGGGSDVPWSIVSMFREYCAEGSFSVLIPYRAHSAATVISLGADEIVMTKKAELGPIDITIETGPYNPKEPNTSQRLPVSVEDVTGYFSLMERVGCERPEEKMRGFEQLTKEVHPLALGMVSRLLEQTKLVALRLLGTRADAFPEEKNRDIVKRLSSEIYSHQHTITRTEAIKHLELNQVVTAESVLIDSELWDLYMEYKELFSFENPFEPESHLVANSLDEHTWQNLPMACIESMPRLDLFRLDMKAKKLPAVPPTINLNVNVGVPNIAFPALPAGITPQQLEQFVKNVTQAAIQGIIDNAAKQAVQELVRSLPSKGFERVIFNQGWRKEV